MDKRGRYQIRKAAGQFWLIDMEQDGEGYLPPIGMNESGALILESFLDAGDVRLCAQKLREVYEIDAAEAEKDAEAFLEQLRSRGVRI